MRALHATFVLFGLGVAQAFLPGRADAQAGAPSLQIAPDVRAEGMGRSFVTLDRSAYAAWGNPGTLGLVRGLDAAAMTTRLVPDLAPDVHLDYQSAVFGIGFRVGDVPFNFNVGANHTYLSYGESVVADPGSPDPVGTFESHETTTGLTAALGIADVVGAGIGVKWFRSYLGPVLYTEVEGKATPIDFGFYARTPPIVIPSDAPGPAWSELRFLGAVAWANSGGDIDFNVPFGSDELPKVRREALGAEFHLIPASRLFPTTNRWLGRLLKDAHLVSVSAAFGREKDLVSSSIPDTLAQYLGRNDREGIITSRGFEVRFLDVLSFRSGYLFDDPGEIKDGTFGWGLSWFGYAGVDYARIPQYRELSKVAKWSFWFRVPFDVGLD